MTPWRDLWSRILPSRTVEPDVDDELRVHLEARVEELIAGGMGPEETRAEARRRFGDLAEVREATRRYAGSRRGGRRSEPRSTPCLAIRGTRSGPLSGTGNSRRWWS